MDTVVSVTEKHLSSRNSLPECSPPAITPGLRGHGWINPSCRGVGGIEHDIVRGASARGAVSWAAPGSTRVPIMSECRFNKPQHHQKMDRYRRAPSSHCPHAARHASISQGGGVGVVVESKILCRVRRASTSNSINPQMMLSFLLHLKNILLLEGCITSILPPILSTLPRLWCPLMIPHTFWTTNTHNVAGGVWRRRREFRRTILRGKPTRCRVIPGRPELLGWRGSPRPSRTAPLGMTKTPTL